MTKLPLALILLAAAAPTLARDRAMPQATPAGKPVDCIGIRQIQQTRVYGDNVIDFVTAGRKVYRNTLPQSCPQLGFEQRFSYRTSLSQLCSTDIITVLTTAGPGLQPGASCGLGQFLPVKLAQPAR